MSTPRTPRYGQASRPAPPAPSHAARTAGARGARPSPPPPSRWGRALRIGALVALAAGLVAVWVWQRTLPLRGVEVAGNARAEAAEIRALAGLERDSVALYAIRPAEVAARVQAHPWVRRALVSRFPTGHLRVRVEEREPAALVLGSDGRPRYFLDREGYAMPLQTANGERAFDVPVLRGDLPAYRAEGPLVDRRLRELLAALAGADPGEDALVSEIEVGRGRLTLLTAPAGAHGPVAVDLGEGDFPDQLARLRAFYTQAVLPQPDRLFERVDLRFAGQVVTRESGPERLTEPASAPDEVVIPDEVPPSEAPPAPPPARAPDPPREPPAPPSQTPTPEP